MNRMILPNGNTQIEDFAASPRRAIGSAVELPMNAWGSTVKRFVVISAKVSGAIVAYELAVA